jgi:small-conductance mechanosensitive channel
MFAPASASNDTAVKQAVLNPAVDSARAVGAVVAPFGTPVFTIFTGIGPITAAARAGLVEKKMRSLAEDPFYKSDSIKIYRSDLAYAVVYGESLINSVFADDAKAEGSTMEAVARYREAKIIYAIREHRESRKITEVLKNVAISAGILLLLVISITLLNKLFKFLRGKAETGLEWLQFRLKLRDYTLLSRNWQLGVLLFLLKLFKWFLILVLIVINLLAIFYLLPWTKAFTLHILGFFTTPLKNILLSLWGFVPNLITIILIIIVSRLIIRFFRFLKVEVEKETLKIPGFYADWALPTFNIIRVLIVIFTIVAIWPFLPGSGSQVFQGISVFFGLVFSLTSASSLSNFMAGLTITYTRAFKLGDRVKIGDVTGDIIEKSMLVTKIKTIKNEEITVPNTKIMSSEVLNYSTCAPTDGLIIHTTVTIGYDAPWRQVHRLLTAAALKTPLILDNPAPFVLQTALNDFYISYQVNAYTRSPNEMAMIFSDLHQNIQDSFNQAGVEIMSPHYRSVRDGNTMAIPEEDRGDDYVAPTFRVEHRNPAGSIDSAG